MTFPDSVPASAIEYLRAYGEQLRLALASVDGAVLERAADAIETVTRAGGTLFVCGNGGSAAVSSHLVCDMVKSVRTDTDLGPRVISLNDNVPILTAVANDLSYAEVFVYQLASLARAGDAVLTISSSGDSENVVRALTWGRDNGLTTLAMTGFEGGRTRAIADISLHVQGDNYGVVEDTHQSLMHILAQYLRLRRIDPALLGARKF